MKPLKSKDWDLPKLPTKVKKPKKPDHIDTVIKVHKLYKRIQEHREDHWRTLLKAFEANPNSVYNAYHYVANHPMFYHFKPFPRHKKEGVPLVHERHLIDDQGWEYVYIFPVMVNPADRRISDDEHLNTRIEFWFELGPTLFRDGIPGHDHKLDGGADSYDQAIIKVAKAIHKHYGNDRRKVVTKWKDIELPTEN